MGPIVLASLLLLSASHKGDMDARVGFLEYNRLDPESEGGGPRATVTAAFKRDGTGWSKADAAEPTRWTVTHEGKRLGNFESTPAGKIEIDADANLGLPDKGSALPKIGKPSREFAGDQGKPVLRPLVLVAAGNYRDPQGWKVKKASAPSALLAHFRKDIAKVRNCKVKGDDKPVAYKYTDRQVQVVKSYKANNGARLIGVHLDGRLNRCEDAADPEWQIHWYLVPAKGGAPVLLGDSMMPLDVGDYDGDGQSEFVFAIQRDDEDGYALFYDGMKKHVEYTWSPN